MQTVKIEITFTDVKLTSEDVERYVAAIIDDNTETADEVHQHGYYINPTGKPPTNEGKTKVTFNNFFK